MYTKPKPYEFVKLMVRSPYAMDLAFTSIHDPQGWKPDVVRILNTLCTEGVGIVGVPLSPWIFTTRQRIRRGMDFIWWEGCVTWKRKWRTMADSVQGSGLKTDFIVLYRSKLYNYSSFPFLDVPCGCWRFSGWKLEDHHHQRHDWNRDWSPLLTALLTALENTIALTAATAVTHWC